jgi:LysR family transcriptional regulator, glycine cleavage system transcriptional activator
MNDWPRKTQPSSNVPLNTLLAFEAAARHMSIKKAAQELNLTPSAISHRLRLLERRLGCRLLFRVGSHLELTEAGEALAPALTAGFAGIMEAVGNVRREQRKQQLA